MAIDREYYGMDPSWRGLLYCDIPERGPIRGTDFCEPCGVHRPGHCAGEWCCSSDEVQSERRVISRGFCCEDHKRKSYCGRRCCC